jgi:glycosyltransferase involved in cell wall biosynthesis
MSMCAPETPHSADPHRAAMTAGAPSRVEPLPATPEADPRAGQQAGAAPQPAATPQAGAAVRGRQVLVVGIDYAPDSTGIAPYTTGLAEHLATRAAGVTVLTGVPRHPDGSVPAAYRRALRFADPAWARPDGPRVIRLRHCSSGAGTLRRAVHELSFLLSAIAYGRSLTPDVVVGITPSPAAAAAAAWLARRCSARLITVVQAASPHPVGAPATPGRLRSVPTTARAFDPTGGEPTRIESPGAGPGGRDRASPPPRWRTSLALPPSATPVGDGFERPSGPGRHRARGRAGLGLAVRVAPALERYALRRSDEVAVVSDAFRPAALSSGVDPQRLHLLPNWTRGAASAESRQSARTALGWPLDRFVVVHAAPMGPRQDLGTVIESARLLSLRSEARPAPADTVDIVLLGDGSQRAALEQQAFGLTHVRFVDPMDEDREPLMLAAADVLLIAETASPVCRATPGQLAGYLGAGRPVLAAAREQGATGCELRRTGGAGVRVDPGDPAAMADALLALLRAPRQRGLMGRAALRYARGQLGRTASLHRLDLIVDAALSPDRGRCVTPSRIDINSVLRSPGPNGRGTVVAPSDGPSDRPTHRGH